VHRLWIAEGNEALAYAEARRRRVREEELWATLYDLRNHLAHSRLPDVDEALVRRFTWMRVDGADAVTRALRRHSAEQELLRLRPEECVELVAFTDAAARTRMELD